MRVFLKTMALSVTLAVGGQAMAQSNEKDGDLLSTALDAVASADWVTADHYASQMDDPVGVDLVIWQRLRRGEGDWDEYADFLARNADWPGLKRLRLKGEAAIPVDHTPSEVTHYFSEQLPQTGRGALRYAEALQSLGRTADARAEASRAWTTLVLGGSSEAKLLDLYEGSLSRHHEQRLENMLWEGETKAAERMLPFVSPNLQKLAKARVALQRASKGVDSFIAAVPEELQDDPGLAYDRFVWRMKKDRWDDAQAMIVERSGNTSTLGRPEAWSNRRRGFARRLMRAGDSDLAYWLASQHELSGGSNYADLEWLSGFIALTQLDAPEQALAHFKNHRSAVRTPVSLGRAGYWMGRAAEALGDFDSAVEHFEPVHCII